TGKGVVRNLADAAAWYRLAAERGNAQAQAKLAALLSTGSAPPPANRPAPPVSLYRNGLGVARDPDTARALAERSAAAGNVEGQALAGYMCAAGIGGTVDMAKA